MSDMFFNCSSLTTIFATDKFVTSTATNSNYMFSGCRNLVGGAGTVFNGRVYDKTYARIDGGEENPGYFTAKTE